MSTQGDAPEHVAPVPPAIEAARDAARRQWDDQYREWVATRFVIVVEMAGVDKIKQQLDVRDALWRLHDHNSTVVAMLEDAERRGGPWNSVVRPLRTGVLLVCDEGQVNDAVALAWRIVEHFDQHDGGRRAALATRSTIGMALGDVVVIPDSAAAAGGDVQGPAVDLAIRLVQESGKAGQILLEEGAHKATDLRKVEAALRDTGERVALDYEPVNGTTQRLRGLSDNVLVRQLKWREEIPPIVNRRRLTVEILKIQKAALDVMTRVNELNRDYRAAVKSKDLDEIAMFHSEMKALADHEDDSGEVAALQRALDATIETEHEKRLHAKCARMLATHRAAEEALGQAKGARQKGEAAFDDAIRDIRDKWSAFENTVVGLVALTQKRIGELSDDE